MIRLLFALAVGAFVLSLPVSRTELGARLRRIAGFAFTLALVPSLIVGLFMPELRDADAAWLLVALPVAVVVAYLVLRYRSAVARPSTRPPRPTQKTPIDRIRRQEQEFFSFISDRQQRTEE